MTPQTTCKNLGTLEYCDSNSVPPQQLADIAAARAAACACLLPCLIACPCPNMQSSPLKTCLRRVLQGAVDLSTPSATQQTLLILPPSA